MIYNDDHGHCVQPTKVLVLIPSLYVGGAEMDLVRNLPRINRSRFKIVVRAFLASGKLAQPLRNAGIEVIGPSRPLPSSSIASGPTDQRFLSLVAPFVRPVVSALTYLRLATEVALFVRKRQIDIVHAVLPNSYVIGGIASALTRRPLVMSRLSMNWYHEQVPLLATVERHMLHRLVDVVVCNSTAIRENLLAEGIAPAKIRLIPNGIDLAAFSSLGIDRMQARDRLGVKQDALVFSLIASFYGYKGHADLLHALRLARDQLPPGWILLAAGRDIDGNLDRMRRLSEELGLASHLRFLGERSDVDVILSAADIHVSASHTEGLPNNVLEAMAASLPVVATAVGGVPDMIINGQTGVLVPAKEPEEMARVLVELARDPERRAFLGEAGRNLVKSSFSLERSVHALEDVYARIAEQRRS